MKQLIRFSTLAAVVLGLAAGFSLNGHAQSSTTTLIHYWNFNNLAGPYIHPNIPPILADYTVLTPADSAYLEYYILPGTSATWAISGVDSNNAGGAQIDNVTSTDTSNLRQGAVSGLALRARNPTDSSELRWHIPSTGFTNLVIKFATETSSLASGDSAQIYSYSVDGGKTWDSTSMTVNGAPGHTLDLTQGGNANSIYLGFSLVTITFGTDMTVNNNPNLIFRIVFRGNTHPNTPVSGNNRFDDFTLDGVGNSGPPPPPPAIITMLTPAPGSIFVPGRSATISFKATSTVTPGRTIQVSSDSGNTWTTVTKITGDSMYTMTVPNIATTKGFVRVTDDSGVTAKIGPFIIFPIPANNLLVHYWAFNTLTSEYYNPNVPNFPADFSANASNIGSLQYVGFSKTDDSGYVDDVAGDTVNAQCGAWAGNALRVRNPTWNMELHWVIPTNGYKGITINYALQSSSTTAPQTERFSYSVDGGLTWVATGITVNGVAQDTLNVLQPQYQQGTGYGPVSIGFGSQTTMDENPNFIFRMQFVDDSSQSSGNNRIDNFSVMASAADGVAEPVQAVDELNVIPNPAQGSVSIANPFTTPAHVTVLDVDGHSVIEMNGVFSQSIDLNTSDLAAGSYYVRIESNGTERIAKFVKQ